MPSAAESQPGPPNPPQAPLEVEEAELSSDAEPRPAPPRSVKRNDQADGDFVLDDKDLEDDDDSYQSLSHPDTNPEESPQHPPAENSRRRSASPNPISDHNDSAKGPTPHRQTSSPNKHSSDSPSPSPGSSSPGDSSSSDDDPDASSASSGDDVDDYDAGSHHQPRRKRKADSMKRSNDADFAADQHNANGNADNSDSDDPSNMVVRKRSRRREKIVIPEDMLNDSEYFRRSGRSRHAPERLSITPPDSPSSAAGGSDSDFNAEDGTFAITLDRPRCDFDCWPVGCDEPYSMHDF